MIFLMVIFFGISQADSSGRAQQPAADSLGGRISADSALAPTSSSMKSSAKDHKGLALLVGYERYHSSLSSLTAGNFNVFVGAGYNITSRFFADLKIYTGTEHTDEAKTSLVSGDFALGGGAIELTYRLFGDGTIRPSITGGYDLATILSSQQSSSGYNGHGYHLQLGGEYLASEFLSVEVSAVYKYRRYKELIINGDSRSIPDPIIDHSVGLNVGCSIQFNSFP
jgi:hypothetical protein